MRLYDDGRLVGEVRGRCLVIRLRPVELGTFWTLAMAADYAVRYGFEPEVTKRA